MKETGYYCTHLQLLFRPVPRPDLGIVHMKNVRLRLCQVYLLLVGLSGSLYFQWLCFQEWVVGSIQENRRAQYCRHKLLCVCGLV